MPARPRSSPDAPRPAGARPARTHRRGPVIAIDGPAGSGKSTVARGVARALGLRLLDTGAMYRALTLQAIRSGVDPANGRALAALARRTRYSYDEDGILIDGRAAGRAIRRPEVSRLVSQVAAHPAVRRVLVGVQREIVGGGGLVVEGRDIGTVVCPAADTKVFLTATAGERARRRHRELAGAGERVGYRTIKRDLERRDELDSTRAASPLAAARDAHIIDSTGRTASQIVREIVGLARRRVPRTPSGKR